MKTILLFDGNNIFHKNYHMEKKSSAMAEAIDLTIAQSLIEFRYYFDKYKPVITMVAFDSKKNWRRNYTMDKSRCVTNKIYKANRSEKKTKKELEAKKLLDDAMESTAIMLKENSRIVVLWEEGLEADDMASGVCRLFGDSDFNIKIVSSDKDYLQFYRYKNVEIVNPLANGKDRNLSEWNNDPDLFLFEKFIRGDAKDNVRSAYPRLRKPKLIEAYYDDLVKSNVLNHTFVEKVFDEDKDDYVDIEFSTEKLFEENRMLLDLNCQPEDIKNLIDSVVEREITRKRKTNFMKFLQFASSRELNNILARPRSFLPLLNNKVT